MKIIRQINHLIDTIKIPLIVTSDALFIQSNIRTSDFVHIYIYNPDQQFVGELIHYSSDLPQKVIMGYGDVTLNGLKHQLVSGLYNFKVIILNQIGQILEPIDLELIVSSDHLAVLNETEHIPSYMFQSESWFRRDYFDRVFNSERRYYRGDCHGHTIYSDGHLNADEVNEVLKDQGLDFMFMTEHNRTAFGYRKGSTVHIPAYEMTFPTGHINIHGLHTNEVIAFGGGLLSMEHCLKNVHRDSNISLNHMFLDEWSFIEKNISMNSINTIELICDPTYATSKVANIKAIKFMDYLWMRGYQIYGVGGSDSHTKVDECYKDSLLPSIYGDPSTYVYSEGLSIRSIINGMKKGNSYICRHINLAIDIGGYLPGEKFEHNDFKYSVTINGLSDASEYLGQFIINGEVVSSTKLNKKNKEASFDMSTYDCGDNWWMRFAVYEDDEVIGYVNPIFRGERACEEKNIDQLIEEFLKYDQSNIV